MLISVQYRSLLFTKKSYFYAALNIHVETQES